MSLFVSPHAKADVSARGSSRARSIAAVNFLERQQNPSGALARAHRLSRRRHRALHVGAAQRRRRADRRTDASRAAARAPIRTNQTYVVVAADDGAVRGRAQKRSAAHSPQRQVAARDADHPRREEGAWSYPSPGGGNSGDPSNSQFALLALYEAERVGVKVDPKTWRMALQYWQQAQNPDGSWTYSKGQPGSGSMTCAGITSLIIASGELAAGDAEVIGGQVRCCGDAAGQRGHRKSRLGIGSSAISRCIPIPAVAAAEHKAAGCCTISTAWNAPAA